MEHEELMDNIYEIMNPSEKSSSLASSEAKEKYKKLVLKDLKGARFEFTGKFELEVVDELILVKAVK